MRRPSILKSKASRYAGGAARTKRSRSALAGSDIRMRSVHCSHSRTFSMTISSITVSPAAFRKAAHSR